MGEFWKIALFIFAVSGICLALNMEASEISGNAVFTVDGERGAVQNITVFVSKDGRQVFGKELLNVPYPQKVAIPFEAGGHFEGRAIDADGNRANASIDIAVPGQSEDEQRIKEELKFTEYAIIIALLGLIAILFVVIKYLKRK
jgi:hypothetical protein